MNRDRVCGFGNTPREHRCTLCIALNILYSWATQQTKDGYEQCKIYIIVWTWLTSNWHRAWTFIPSIKCHHYTVAAAAASPPGSKDISGVWASCTCRIYRSLLAEAHLEKSPNYWVGIKMMFLCPRARCWFPPATYGINEVFLLFIGVIVGFYRFMQALNLAGVQL